MTTVSIIAAVSENRVIGNQGVIPWQIPEDLKRFKQLTLHHPVIMGRKTFASIGHPLPNRLNIVITHQPPLREWNSFAHRDFFSTHSFEKALEFAKQKDQQEIFIIGGGQIYEQAIDLADKLYLTVVKCDFSGDAFFPDYSRFNKVLNKEEKFDGKYHYTFLELVPDLKT